MSATTTAARPVPAVGTTVQYASKAGNAKPYTVASHGWVVLNGAGQPFTLADAIVPAGTKVGDRVPYTTKSGKALSCPVVERAVFLRSPNSSGYPFGVGVSRVVLPAAAEPVPAVQSSAPQTAAQTAVPTPAAAKPAPAAPKPVAAPVDHTGQFARAAAHVAQAVAILRSIGVTPDNGETGRMAADLERIGGVLADRAATPKPAATPAAVPQTAVDAAKAEQAAAAALVAKRAAEQAAAVQAAAAAAPVPQAAQTAKPAAVPTPAPVQNTGDPLAGYRRLQAACKAAKLPSKGTKAELTARLAAHKPAAQPAAPLTAPSTVKAAPLGTLYVADGKGGFRPATEGEIWAALDAMSKAGK